MVMSAPQSSRSTPTAREAELEHAAIDATAGEIDVDVGDVAHPLERVEPVAAAADVGQDEAGARVTLGELAELVGIGRFLSRVLAAAMLPDVVQQREPELPGEARRRDRAADRWRGGSRRA